MLADYKLTLSPLDADSAQGKAGELLQKAEKEMGFVPNMYANMVHSPGLLATYMASYTAFRKESGFSPQEQETVFLTISQENGCEYCVSAHSMIAAKQAGIDSESVQSLREGSVPADEKLAALSTFTRTLVKTRGLPSESDAKSFLKAGYAEKDILEVVLAIAVKTLSNFSNHLFHTQLDPAFSEWEWKDK